MTKIQDNNYISIQGWMITKLKLTGKKLILFALIYGFSQTPGTYYTGSLAYASEWMDCDRTYVSKVLAKLIEEGLIWKEDVYDTAGKCVGMRCKVTDTISKIYSDA